MNLPAAPFVESSGLAQPRETIIQYAFTVHDIRAAASAWTAATGIGPWYVRGPFVPVNARYRDEPTAVELTLARAFSGAVMIELVQQHNDAPSVYREGIDRSGYGFHHVAIATDDLDGTLARYRAEGYEVAFEDVLPTGARVVYVDTRGTIPAMVELVGMTSAQDDTYARIYRASLGWDGAQPFRIG